VTTAVDDRLGAEYARAPKRDPAHEHDGPTEDEAREQKRPDPLERAQLVAKGGANGPDDMMAMQRTAGNRAAVQLLREGAQRIPDTDTATPADTAAAGPMNSPGPPGSAGAAGIGAPPGAGGGAPNPPPGSGNGAPTPKGPPVGQRKAADKAASAAGTTPDGPGGGGAGPVGSGSGSPDTAAPTGSKPATTPGAGGTTPANARSGTDWANFFNQNSDAVNMWRAFLEITRPIPGLGILTGLGADALNTGSDLAAMEKVDEPFTEGVVILRDSTMIVNNAIGGLTGLFETIQDLATSSAVFAEVDAVTGPAIAGLKEAKVFLDGMQITFDVVVAASARYHAGQFPEGSEARGNWNNILTNYESNILGDALTTIVDAVDLATMGAANGDNVSGIARTIKTIFKEGSKFKQAVLAVLQGWFGVYGSNIMPEAGTPERVFLQMISAQILEEIETMRAAWQVGDVMIQGATMVADEQLSQLNVLLEALTGADAYTLIQQATLQVTTQAEEAMSNLNSMVGMAGDAHDKTDWIIEQTTSVIAAIDALDIPDVSIPAAQHSDDENVIEGAITDLVNAGVELANEQLRAGLESARGQLVTMKEDAKSPVRAIQDKAGEIGAFAQALQDEAQATIQMLTDKVASFNERLAHCSNFEDLANLLIAQVTEALGLPGLTVADVRQLWNDIPTQLDQAAEWARNLPTRGVGSSLGLTPSQPTTSGPTGGAATPTPPGDGAKGNGAGTPAASPTPA
jgi:hypothetical protein